MNSFNFYSPTEIEFGRGAELRVGELAKKHGGSRVFVIYGGGSAVKSGLLDCVTERLSAEGLDYALFGGAKPNPLLSHAREGVRLALEFKADLILAVGGGSVIDTAKAVGIGAFNPDTDIWDFWASGTPSGVLCSLPIGVVLTISAAGSEASNSAVLTNSETSEKRGLKSEMIRPRFAVMNPELTYTLNPYHTACGVVDIMMHTLERYFAGSEGNSFTDGIAEALMRTVVSFGPKTVFDRTDYESASEIMWCGSLSHNGLTGLGRPMDFSVHQLGHELGGRFDAIHGAALSTMWGSWAEYVKYAAIPRFARYAREVWSCGEADDSAAADAGIARTVKFFSSIKMPVCFSELGIGVQSAETIDALAESCVFCGRRKVGVFRPLDKADVIKIYSLANR